MYLPFGRNRSVHRDVVAAAAGSLPAQAGCSGGLPGIPNASPIPGAIALKVASASLFRDAFTSSTSEGDFEEAPF